jgi:STE24 endopeptidase
VSADALSPFTAEEVERARAYHQPLYLVWPVRIAIDLAVLAALAFTGLGDLLFDPFDGWPWWSQTAVYVAIAIGLTVLLLTPIAFWSGYRREHAWRFSTQKVSGWALDRLKGLGIGIVLTGGAMVGLVGLARWFPSWWAVVAAVVGSMLVVLLSFVAPVVLEPLFNRFAPLADEELTRSLRELSVRAGVPVKDVLVADASRRTRKQNAYVSGFGRTRRLVLYDTLVEDGDESALRVIFAHELGHRRAGHIVQGTLLGVLGTCVVVVLLWAVLQWQALLDALDVSGPADPRVVPFVLLLGTVLQLLGLPPGSAVSRHWERQADRFAVELTSDAGGFERMMRRLAVANLSDLDPPRLVYLTRFSHPTPPERIAAARRLAGAG